MEKVRCGDVLFSYGKGIVSSGIKLITRSSVTHVGIIMNKDWIFETHWGQNARLNPLEKYERQNYLIMRPPVDNTDRLKVQDRIKKYNGSRYSTLDIINNFLFCWLPTDFRRDAVSFLGTKGLMICSEITARILWESNKEKFAYLDGFEGLRPDGLKALANDYNWTEL